MSDRINPSIPIHEVSGVGLPASLREAIALEELSDHQGQYYKMGGCFIIITRDPPDNLIHLSISRKDRDPSWSEIATARYRLLPHVEEMAMYLPPLDEYVNLHPFTFHLHEAPRSRLILVGRT